MTGAPPRAASPAGFAPPVAAGSPPNGAETAGAPPDVDVPPLGDDADPPGADAPGTDVAGTVPPPSVDGVTPPTEVPGDPTTDDGVAALDTVVKADSVAASGVLNAPPRFVGSLASCPTVEGTAETRVPAADVTAERTPGELAP